MINERDFCLLQNNRLDLYIPMEDAYPTMNCYSTMISHHIPHRKDKPDDIDKRGDHDISSLNIVDINKQLAQIFPQK